MQNIFNYPLNNEIPRLPAKNIPSNIPRKFGLNIENRIDNYPLLQSKQMLSSSNKENSSLFSNQISLFNIPTKPKIIFPSKPKTPVVYHSQKSKAIVQSPFPSNLTCDLPYHYNPQHVPEYINDIFSDLLCNMDINKPEPGSFGHIQKEISYKHRNILIDWLLEVHVQFKLREETMFLTVNLIDRILGLQHVKKTELQLVGTTCLLIASKYEEIYSPEIRDLEYITEKSCKYEEFISKEMEILTKLDFDILTVYSYTLLQRIHHISLLPKKVFHLALFVLECMFFDEEFLKYDDFIKALSALYLAKAVLIRNHDIPNYLSKVIKEKKKEIKECVILVMKVIQVLKGMKLTAVFKKFRSEEYSEVTKDCILEKYYRI